MTHLHIPADRFIEVKDGETLSLGGKTLEFVYLPWVHWPETMGTYLREEKVLFSCDFFGSHLATSSLFSEEHVVYEPMKRYFAEIMMPFRSNIKSHLEKLARCIPTRSSSWTSTATGPSASRSTRRWWPTSPCTAAPICW
jgi:flavorubredoxin